MSNQSDPSHKPLSLLPPPRRRPGAPKGNRNALKHGFYADQGLYTKQGFYDRMFKQADLSGLEECKITDLKNEINLLRVLIRRVINMGSEIDNLAEAIDLLRALSLASTSLNRLIRTQALLFKEGDEVGQAIQQALEEVAKELGMTDSENS